MKNDTSSKDTTSAANKYPWYAPRFWQGMRPDTYLRMIRPNWRKISKTGTHLGMTCTTLCISVANWVMSVLQEIEEYQYLRRAKVSEPPLFIIGHWRTGTTFLHELLVRNEHFTFPTTYECFAPHHFLFSGDFVSDHMAFLVPKKRPMDNMAVGWRSPQEDEFALMSLGLPSPYLSIAFPNEPPAGFESLDSDNFTPEQCERWKRTLLWFLERIAARELMAGISPRRIVLKSPPHTGRIRAILELFPDAQFVHIVRDPFEVFPSTVKLWKNLYEVQGFQKWRDEGIEEKVFDGFTRMYDAFSRQRELLAPWQLSEVRYENLTRDPEGEVRRIYDELDLGDFEAARPRMARYLAGVGEYRRNRYEMDPAREAQIRTRWGAYLEEYGYARR